MSYIFCRVVLTLLQQAHDYIQKGCAYQE
jgi:hypothetical protein